MCVYIYILAYIPSLLSHLPTAHPPIPLVHHRVHHSQAGLPGLYSSFPLATHFTHGSIYICQCYFLNSSHLLLPTLYTKICSLCEDLYSCPTNRVHQYHFSRFYIYALIYDMCFLFMTYFTLYNGLYVHSLQFS